MNTAPPPSVVGWPWQRQLLAALGCALLGMLVHLATFVPVQLATVGLAVGVIGSAFLLGWAADAGEAVFHGGLVLAAVALATVLPELIIEVRFAFTQQAELVTANLTGATRLLLTGAIAMPLAAAYIAYRRRQAAVAFQLAASRRLELAILLIASIFALQIVTRGELTLVDGIVLLALYLLYARRVQGTPDEEPAVVGVPAGLLSLPPRYRRRSIAALVVVAAAVIAAIANPFADALLETGTSLGLDPYLLIQSIVPLATEAPEFVVVAVLVAHRRPAQGLALFLAASVSQWTLAIGVLPFAYLAGGGGPGIALGGREQVELVLTIAVTLFVVAALASRRPEATDSWLMLCVFAVELAYPTPFVRIALAFILLVYAINLLCARRHDVGRFLRTALVRRRAPG
ncbi:MAG: cation:H+ antiporter [Gaiellaceae bacterium]|nr:cation:H+ antiporter [Gaiellaceae bacterium]